jgi:two-component system sensor histidine kinase TctE
MHAAQQPQDVTDKLLLLAQAESAHSSLFHERVDMASVVSGAFEELAVIAQQRQIDLGADLGEDLGVTGKESLLSALMMNLVDNAIRYTQVGGNVTVACRREEEEIVLEVIDNGPGIAAEARSCVFERFYRATTHGEGTGLGLSIVKEIAQSHGGTVKLAPGPGAQDYPHRYG